MRNPHHDFKDSRHLGLGADRTLRTLYLRYWPISRESSQVITVKEALFQLGPNARKKKHCKKIKGHRTEQFSTHVVNF